MSIKKIVPVLGSMLLLLVVTACTATGGSATESAAAAPAGAQPAAGAPALSQRARLALGTLQLEGTDLEVDELQAADLLLLWQALRALDESAIAAEAERTALLSQIEATMTAEQREAIAGMDLTPENLRTILQERGIGFGAQGGVRRQGGEGGPPVIGQGGPPGGFQGGPQGGVPGAGGPAGGGPNPSGTPVVRTGAGGGLDRFATQAVIQWLEQKAGQGTK